MKDGFVMVKFVSKVNLLLCLGGYEEFAIKSLVKKHICVF